MSSQKVTLPNGDEWERTENGWTCGSRMMSTFDDDVLGVALDRIAQHERALDAADDAALGLILIALDYADEAGTDTQAVRARIRHYREARDAD